MDGQLEEGQQPGTVRKQTETKPGKLSPSSPDVATDQLSNLKHVTKH